MTTARASVAAKVTRWLEALDSSYRGLTFLREQDLPLDSRQTVRVDQDAAPRRCRGLHVMLVAAERVRDVPVVEARA